MEEQRKSQSYEVSLDDDWAESFRPSLPEHRLLAAIMRRSIYDYVLYRRLPKRDLRRDLAIESIEWIFHDDEDADSEDRYTFIFVCGELGLDPRAVRARVPTLTKNDLKRLNHKLRED